MFSLLCLFVALVVSHFGFEGRTLVLIASVTGHCLPFKFYEFKQYTILLSISEIQLLMTSFLNPISYNDVF